MTRLRYYATLAQSVERIHGKDEVIGSIPISGSFFCPKISLLPWYPSSIPSPRDRPARLSYRQQKTFSALSRKGRSRESTSLKLEIVKASERPQLAFRSPLAYRLRLAFYPPLSFGFQTGALTPAHL